jgi:hypothetical protein
VALFALFVALSAFFAGCSDDDSSIEFLFDREISDVSVLQECAKDADSGAYCFKVRFRYPIDTENLETIYLWVDSTVVGDTAKTVNDDKIAKATDRFKFPSGTESLFDTIDVTSYIQDFVKAGRDSLLVAIYCDYSSGRPGTVQRVYLHFGDKIDPSVVTITDSMWTTGYLVEWSRSTDQTNYYEPNELSGIIYGYNIEFYTEDKDEDIRNLKVKLETPDGIDSTGENFKIHYRITANNDSMWVDTVSHGDRVKNYLRIMVADGKGYNQESLDSNVFRLVVEGLKAESRYSITISSWDVSKNESDKFWKNFMTTDSVAPLMPTKLFAIKDSLFPETARLDSNNRLAIFWSRSVDPYKRDHGIGVDTVLTVPDTCLFQVCYDTVQTYRIERLNPYSGTWDSIPYTGGSNRYSKLYKISDDTMKVASTGTFVTDTIRWVSPGDTLIIRIRSIDMSGYYSIALVDTIVVSPGELANEIECPEGFVPVKAADTTELFCMERLEHQNDSGSFMTNVLHSEALATCEAMSADGFRVSLCNERDWELVCLSGGKLAYGVVQEDTLDVLQFLITDCNVSTNDSVTAMDVSKRTSRCMNSMGVRDLPGQLQEWVNCRSEDTLAVLKGGSYKILGGIDR